MLGVVSYAWRWSIGIGDRYPSTPMRAGEVLDEARRLGLSVVQFADNLPLHTLADEEIDALGRKAREAGIALEVGQQGADMALLDRYLELAGRLEADIVRMALDATDAEQGQDVLTGAFTEAAAKAGERGVTLAVENHFGFPSARLAALVDEVGSAHLGVCLDVANSICAGEWPQETIERLAPYTVNLHLKDFDIVPDPYGVGFRVLGTPLGRGRLDIDRVLDTLDEARRDYNVLLEHWLPGEGVEIGALAAREREWIEQSVAEARRRLSDRD